MISNIINLRQPIYKTVYPGLARTERNNTAKNKPYNNYDTNITNTVSFNGLRVNHAKSHEEIKEIVNLFYDALKHNIKPNKKLFFEKILRRILTYPFVINSKLPTTYTETVKSGDKLVGGYSLNIDILNSTSHLNFMTLTPDVMKTKTGAETLKLMAKRICQNLENNCIKEMTWSTNSKNKPMNNLLKRLSPEKNGTTFTETKYKISLEQLKNVLDI